MKFIVVESKTLEELAEKLNTLSKDFRIDEVLHVQPMEGKMLLRVAERMRDEDY